MPLPQGPEITSGDGSMASFTLSGPVLTATCSQASLCLMVLNAVEWG